MNCKYENCVYGEAYFICSCSKFETVQCSPNKNEIEQNIQYNEFFNKKLSIRSIKPSQRLVSFAIHNIMIEDVGGAFFRYTDGGCLQSSALFFEEGELHFLDLPSKNEKDCTSHLDTFNTFSMGDCLKRGTVKSVRTNPQPPH